MTYEQCLNKAAKYCSSRETSTYDILVKLNQWKVPKQWHEKIIKKLKEENFINHQRYAFAFVHDKFTFNKWGRIKIANALKNKSIEQQFIDQALSTIDSKEYIKTLTTLLKNKISTIKYNNNFQLRNKLINFALSKGYEYELIRDIVNDLLNTDK